MVGYPQKGQRYRSRKHPHFEYEIVGIAEPLRFCGSIIETRIILADDQNSLFHCTLYELTQQYRLVYSAAEESVKHTPYPSPTAAFRAWETEV